MTLGLALALLGAALAVGLTGFGSAIGIGLAGQVGSGVTAEDPEKFGKIMVLEALPSSQSIYGLVAAFLVLNKLGDPLAQIDTAVGAQILAACLAIAIAGCLSAIYQGKVAAASINIIAKTGDLGKAMILTAMVETVAVFGLLATILILRVIAI